MSSNSQQNENSQSSESISNAEIEISSRQNIRQKALIEKRLYNGHSCPLACVNGLERTHKPFVPRRCEDLRKLPRPLGIYFFLKVACRCSLCKQQQCQCLNHLRGFNCVNSLTARTWPEDLRQYRSKSSKSIDYMSPLARRIKSAVHKRDIFGPENCIRNPSVSKCRLNYSLGSADWSVEVVVIITSLRSSGFAFSDSRRIQHLLDCKGVEYFCIDVNEDIGRDGGDRHLLLRWRHLQWIYRDRDKKSKSKRDILAPQVLADGIPMGSFMDIQVLEDENDLDYILAREACPNCLANRTASCGPPAMLNSDGTRLVTSTDKCKDAHDDFCKTCGAVFRELVNVNIMNQGLLDLLVLKNSLKCQGSAASNKECSSQHKIQQSRVSTRSERQD